MIMLGGAVLLLVRYTTVMDFVARNIRQQSPTATGTDAAATENARTQPPGPTVACCGACGTQLPDAVAFCPVCGARRME